MPQPDIYLLIGLYILHWRLFEHVSRGGLDFRNYILLVAFYLLEIYLTSSIARFWDSVPDGSLQ